MPPSESAAVPPSASAGAPASASVAVSASASVGVPSRASVAGPHGRRRAGLASLLGAVLAATALVTALVVGVPGAAQRADAAAGAGCAAGSVLNVVAHPDDDLLFQGTQLRSDIEAGRCVRSVVVTAGDAGYPRWYWGERQTGLMAAYAGIAGAPSDWTTGSTVVAGHTVHTETLTAAPRISLVFLELPDGNVEGNGFWADGYQSLEHLYEGSLDAIDSVADATHPTSYTLSDLRATLLALVRWTAPSSIHTLDHEGSYGDGDHSDHHTVAYLTDEVQRASGTSHGFTGFMGYPIADRPTNLTAAQTDAKAGAFFTYAAHDDQTCTSRAACADRWEDAWFSRQYTVGTPATDPGTTPDPGSGSTPGTGTGTPGTQPTTTNVAGSAVVTASAENPADGQTARGAVDGVVSGYPEAPTAEWVAPGGGAG
ncbi:PIG-L family deacetylase, partial [Curtobacterium sp. UCD-KPL2560]|uniref:PIG-L family deacetylase n=1 Tax=Curtobacterium sp. UCD-KPL2560 TaxID=1885315 RepID=UPI000B2E4431